APEGSPEETLATLQQRLEEAEGERDSLRTDLGRLEEVLAEEQAKAAQLKARLDVAESGPDKLTKKEINFWRSKVDEFDRTNREHKARIAELRRELQERDARIESLAERERQQTEALTDAQQKATEAADEATRRIAELEHASSGLGARIDEQAARITELESTLAERADAEQARRLAADAAGAGSDTFHATT